MNSNNYTFICKHSIFLIVFLLASSSLHVKAQQAFVTSGYESTGPGGTASSSIGQIDYITAVGAGGTSQQGVQQPFVPCLGTEWYEDVDGDGYGSPFMTQEACSQPVGYASNACSEPLNATVNNITSVSAKVSFDGLPEGAFRCAVWFRAAGDTQYRKSYATGDQTQVNLSNLTPDTEYEWKMRTRCGLVDGDTSDFVMGPNFTTPSACNATVNGITVFASSNWARVRWAASPNAVSYKLRYRTVGVGTWASKITAAPTLTRRINGLSATAYEYTLEALCANGVAGPRSSGTFTPTGINGRFADDSSEEWAFSIHPNPSNGRFTVTPLAEVEGMATVMLFDVAGRTVLTQTWSASEDATLVFDKQMDNGMYLLTITAADGQTFTSRVVIAN